MKIFSKTARTALSVLLAVVMLTSVFVTGAPAVFAADTKTAQTADATPDELDPAFIESMEIEPVTLFKGYGTDTVTEYDEATDTELTYERYSIYSDSLNGKLILKDGTELDISDGWVSYDEDMFRVDASTDQSYKNQWGVGKHTATAEFNGFKADFEVEVIDYKIKGISAKPIKIYEGINCYKDYDYDDDAVTSFLHYEYDPEFTVTLADDTEVEANEYGFVTILGESFHIEVKDDQNSLNPWKVGTNHATASLLGAEVTFDVEILPSPVKELEITGDVTVYEKLNQEETEYYNEDDDVEYWDKYVYKAEYKVTLDDGTVLESDEDYQVRIGGKWLDLTIEDDQSYDNQWKYGEHLATAVLCGVDTEFKVIVKENPIEKLEALDNYTVYEGFDQIWCSFYEDDEIVESWQEYRYKPEFKLTLKDGSTILSDEDGDIEFNGKAYTIDFKDDQSADNQWEYGDHVVKASVFGVTTEFTVTVKKNPVKSLKIKDVELYENIGRHWIGDDEDEYLAYVYTPEFTVTLDDGTKLEGSRGRVEILGQKVELNIEDGQNKTRWGLGTHKAVGTIAGVSAKFNVDVVELPIEKIEPKDVVSYKNVDFFYEADEAEEYTYPVVDYTTECTVTFKDGSTFETKNGGFSFNGSWVQLTFESEQNKGNVWDVGTHKATVSFGKISVEYTVEVLPTPFEKLEVEDVVVYEDIDTYIDYDYDEENGTRVYAYYPKFKVTDKNGKVYESESVFEYDPLPQCIRYRKGEFVLDYEDGQDKTSWKVGTYTVKASIFGLEAEFNVEVKPNPVKSIECTDVQLIENVDGYMEEYYDEDVESYFDYFCYRIPNDAAVVTATLTDGTTITSEDGVFVLNGRRYFVETDSIEQNPYKPLEAGDKAEFEGTAFNIPFKGQVEIISTPVKSVEIAPIKLVKGSDSYKDYDDDNDEEYNCYDIPIGELSFTVTLQDGTVLKSEDGSVKYNGIEYSVEEVLSGQSSENEWQTGKTYSVSASVMGVKTSFDITPIETPVEKAEFEDIYVDGSNIDDWEDGHPVYFIYPKNFKLTLKDGTVLTPETDRYYSSVIFDGRRYSMDYFSSNQQEEPWEIGGVYDVEVNILGFKGTAKVHVIDKAPEEPTETVEPIDTTPIETNPSETVQPTETAEPIATNPTVVEPTESNAPTAPDETIAPTESVEPSTAATVPSPTVTPSKKTVKKANPAKIKVTKKKTVKAKTLKKKKVTFKPVKVTKAQGKVSFKKVSGKKNFTVNAKTGKVTIKKKTKKGIYKVKIKVTVKGNTKYKKKTKTVTVKIKVR